MSSDKTIEIFNRVLEKYRLTEPTPVEVRRRAARAKSKQFSVILKRAGGYSIIFALVAKLFFALKRMGLAVTVVQSAVIITLLSVLSAGGLSTGAWLLFKSRMTLETKPDALPAERREAATESALPGQSTPADEETPAAEPADVIEDRLGVQPFVAVNSSGAEAGQAADAMASVLAGLRGANRVVNYRTGQKWKKSGLMLMGSLERAEAGYTLTARVVNVRDSRILFYDTEMATTAADIQGACERLAQRIYGKIR